MRFGIQILPDALSDILAGAIWYEQQASGLGTEFAREVNRTIDRLSRNALLFRIRYRRKRVRWTYPRRFPFRICYYVKEHTVSVFAVVHAARHKGEWKKRL